MGLNLLAGGATAAACILATAVAAPAFAAAPTRAPSSIRIGPHLTYGATVNGRTTGATIRMACFGPTRPGRTGHPLTGQNLGVFIPEVLQLPAPGNTGARGRAIVAGIDSGHGHIIALARFTRLKLGPIRSATKPLPTRPILPCDGGARVVFTPTPGGAGAASAVVNVTFVSQP